MDKSEGGVIAEQDEARWAALFGDLDAALTAEDAADRDDEVADRVVAERGRLRMIDRLRPALHQAGPDVVLRARGHQPLRGRVTALGADWVVLTGARSEEWLVPLGQVSWLRGLGPESAEPGWEGLVGARQTLRLALRRLLREGDPVTAATTEGDMMTGVITTVAGDHLELRLPESEPVILTLAALAYVSRR